MQKYYEILNEDFNIQPIAFNFDTITIPVNKIGLNLSFFDIVYLKKLQLIQTILIYNK